MSLPVVLLLVITNIAFVLRHVRGGVVVYVVLSLLVPHPEIAGVTIAYEIVALPAVLVAVAIRRPRLYHLRFHLFLGAYLVVVIISTILGTTTHGTDVELIRFQGIVRFLVLLGLVRELLDRVRIEQILLVVVGANAVVGMVQLLVPGMARIFFGLYGRPSQAVLERYALEDVIPRASGTFSSPVILGSVALLAIAVGWAGLVAGRTERRYRWLLLLAGIAGIVSLTKTFLLGAPLVLAGGAMLSLVGRGVRPLRFKPRSFATASGAVLVVAGLMFWTAGYLSGLGFNVGYYASFIVDPRAALATRYGVGGLLGGTMQVIAENPLLGVGITRVQGEFLGDSSYTMLLHSTGIVGAAFGLIGLGIAVNAIYTWRRPSDFVVLGAFLIAGIGLPIAFSLSGALIIAYLLQASPDPPGTGRLGYMRKRAQPPEPLSVHV